MAHTNFKTMSDTQIIAAYRQLVFELHPDRNPNDPQATVTFQSFQERYQQAKDRVAGSKKSTNRIATYKVKFSISLQESIEGCDRYVSLNGTTAKVMISIPAGVKDGNELTYKKLKIDKNTTGVLKVEIGVDLPGNYKIVNNFLICIVKVSRLKLLIGGKAMAYGPCGEKFSLKIKRLSKPGILFEATRAGLYNSIKNERDTLYIQVTT